MQSLVTSTMLQTCTLQHLAQTCVNLYMYLASTSRLYVAVVRHIDRLNIDSVVSLLNDTLAARVIMIREGDYKPYPTHFYSIL